MANSAPSTGPILKVPAANDVAGWPTKKAATAHLAGLRARGLNVETDIQVNRAVTPLFRFWVISRPDHYAVTTSLMTRTGAWLLGRIYDATPCYDEPKCKDYHPAPWEQLAPEPSPPTFTHVTRTVLAAGRKERYRTKSNGSCGRWVRDDDAVALCTCGWKAHTSTRDEARWRARDHRTNPPPTREDA